MNSGLHQAFLNTTYRVLKRPIINLKINQLHPELDYLKNWAFITAWNPLSKNLSLEDNQKRNQSLEEDIKVLGLKYYSAIGISQDEKWSEESFFIENIELVKANELALKYDQWAFVHGLMGTNAILYYTIS